MKGSNATVQPKSSFILTRTHLDKLNGCDKWEASPLQPAVTCYIASFNIPRSKVIKRYKAEGRIPSDSVLAGRLAPRFEFHLSNNMPSLSKFVEGKYELCPWARQYVIFIDAHRSLEDNTAYSFMEQSLTLFCIDFEERKSLTFQLNLDKFGNPLIFIRHVEMLFSKEIHDIQEWTLTYGSLLTGKSSVTLPDGRILWIDSKQSEGPSWIFELDVEHP